MILTHAVLAGLSIIKEQTTSCDLQRLTHTALLIAHVHNTLFTASQYLFPGDIPNTLIQTILCPFHTSKEVILIDFLDGTVLTK